MSNTCANCADAQVKAQKLDEIVAKYKDTRGALIPVLHEAQEVYGYLPLEVQRDFERILMMRKKTGIALTDSLLMSPSKSVTAIVGICGGEPTEKTHKCSLCDKTDCEFRGEL